MKQSIEAVWDQRDERDTVEGMQAYARYKKTMRSFAEATNFSVDIVTAAFCALSPNNDYTGNLRSLKSCLEWSADRIDMFGTNFAIDELLDATQAPVVTTYNACAVRALKYIFEEEDFLTHCKGLKTRAFYHNILYPAMDEHVTIDGHMICIWHGKNMTMKEAQVNFNDRMYKEMQQDFIDAAKELHIYPYQLQAVLWFTRKRVNRIKYVGTPDLFGDPNDVWQTFRKFEDVPSF